MSKQRRVVVTGLGVISPIGHGLKAFEESLRAGRSGIRFVPALEELNFRCQVGGIPQDWKEVAKQYVDESDLLAMNEAMTYGAIAAIDAWKDAGLKMPEPGDNEVNWDAGCVVGSGLSGIDTVAQTLVPQVNAKRVRRMGSTLVEQTMASSISAKLSGLLALGNQVTSNSSACNTGTEAIQDAYLRIVTGQAEIMLAGGAESSSPYIWAGFDSMRVLNSDSNASPEKASRPMSRSAGGFIPGSGAGVIVLESLESAQKRGARIYAELRSAVVNCGGHRNGGSMTAPNSESVQRCIRAAIEQAGIRSEEIDLVSGHLTATMADPLEVRNWSLALERSGDKFPNINAPKSLFGHCLGAAGSIEAVAVLLQLAKGFIHPSINCEDVHQDIEPFAGRIARTLIERDLRIAAKASFGFGDVNGCLIFEKWN